MQPTVYEAAQKDNIVIKRTVLPSVSFRGSCFLDLLSEFSLSKGCLPITAPLIHVTRQSWLFCPTTRSVIVFRFLSERDAHQEQMVVVALSIPRYPNQSI
jgi:hypothetical protein